MIEKFIINKMPVGRKGGLFLKKEVQKSVRMTNEVAAYVEQMPGEGFNRKFENLVLAFKRAEPERLRKIANYDELIEKKKRQLEIIAAKTLTLDVTIQAIFSLQDEVRKIQRQLDELLNDDG